MGILVVEPDGHLILFTHILIQFFFYFTASFPVFGSIWPCADWGNKGNGPAKWNCSTSWYFQHKFPWYHHLGQNLQKKRKFWWVTSTLPPPPPQTCYMPGWGISPAERTRSTPQERIRYQRPEGTPTPVDRHTLVKAWPLVVLNLSIFTKKITNFLLHFHRLFQEKLRLPTPPVPGSGKY